MQAFGGSDTGLFLGTGRSVFCLVAGVDSRLPHTEARSFTGSWPDGDRGPLEGTHVQSAQSCLVFCDPMTEGPLSMGFSRQECWSGSLFPSLLKGHTVSPSLESTPCIPSSNAGGSPSPISPTLACSPGPRALRSVPVSSCPLTSCLLHLCRGLLGSSWPQWLREPLSASPLSSSRAFPLVFQALQSNLRYSLLPRRLVISKRLAQCLHPALPSGVHLKALETYEIIFKIVGTKWLAKDLFLYR